MTNTIDLQSILTRLETIQPLLAELMRVLGIDPTRTTWLPPIAIAIQRGIASQTLTRLRPLFAEHAVWEDRAAGSTYGASELAGRHDHQNWAQAFPDFIDEITNVISTEDVLVIEHRATGTHLGPLRMNGQVYQATRQKISLQVADVVSFKNGKVDRINHYHDSAGLLRQLGLMRDIPFGHDEPHPHGAFQPDAGVPEVPVTIGASISVGSSGTRRAKENIATLTAIHESFIDRTPERFHNAIAEDALWIDVPTGQVLNGLEAAMQHDYGNWARAFPDSTAEIVHATANADWGIVQHIGSGHHHGELRLGDTVYGPTGRSVEIRVLDVVQFKDGKAVLIRNYYDVGNLLNQLGIVDQWSQ